MDDTPENRAEASKRIREARLACGLANASEFARLCGVTPQTVYRWENPENPIVPDIFRLHTVARVTSMTMEWIVAGQADESRAALRDWLATPSGQAAPPEAVSFLERVPIAGYSATPLFYELALAAFRAGLTVDEAARAARMTAGHLDDEDAG